MQRDEIRAFREVLREFERVLTDSYEQTCSESGVTVSQCHVLIELEVGSHMSVSDLAQRLDLDRSTVSRTVDALVSMGLVLRREDPSDRRLKKLELTPKGRETTEDLQLKNDAYFGRILGDIPSGRWVEVAQAFELVVRASRAGMDET